MYIKLNDSNVGMLTKISEKERIPLDMKLVNGDLVIEEDTLFDFIYEMKEKFNILEEEHEYLKEDIKENYIKVQEGYEYGE